jgi:hypothetical protein
MSHPSALTRCLLLSVRRALVSRRRYTGKMEVWLAGAKTLCIFWGDVSLTLPLSSSALGGGAGLPVSVVLNNNQASVDTVVTGYGLLPSNLSFCPQQDGGVMPADDVVYVGEVYCLRHTVPLLPDGLVLSGQRLTLDTQFGAIDMTPLPGTLVFNAAAKYVEFAAQMVFAGPQAVKSQLQFALPGLLVPPAAGGRTAAARTTAATLLDAQADGSTALSAGDAAVSAERVDAVTTGQQEEEPAALSEMRLAFTAIEAPSRSPTPSPPPPAQQEENTSGDTPAAPLTSWRR